MPHLTQTSPQAAPFTSPENRTADFYVAIYNNNQRFVGGSQQPNQVANVTLRVSGSGGMEGAGGREGVARKGGDRKGRRMVAV